jgi:hypothetical protein
MLERRVSGFQAPLTGAFDKHSRMCLVVGPSAQCCLLPKWPDARLMKHMDPIGRWQIF